MRNDPLQGSPFGFILGSFLEPNSCIFNVMFLIVFLDHFFIDCWLILVSILRGVCLTFCHTFENSEIVKNRTASRRDLKNQGLAGYVFLYFCCFLGFGFWMAPGMDF